MNLEENKIHLGDSLVLDREIPDKSVDMILEDMPYGITACKFDQGKISDEQREFLKWLSKLSYDDKHDKYLRMVNDLLKALFKLPVDLANYWESRTRIIKDNGAIVLTASQPFTSLLILSNLKMFKYEWIWEKNNGTNFLNAKQQPLKTHENILIFSYASSSYSKNICMEYNPQMTDSKPYSVTSGRGLYQYHQNPSGHKTVNCGVRFPRSNIKIYMEKGKHPTQKPVALFEYLIKTYTNERDLVLDGFAGSGTTAIACLNTNRRFICIEKESEYFEKAKKRIEIHQQQIKLGI